jgi:hypothetical protein
VAYPFTSFPKLSDFINRVTEEFEVELVDAKGKTIGPRGIVRMRYFVRDHGGKKLRVPIPDFPEEERLAPTQLRQLCNRLEIPLSEFGFELTEDGINWIQ